jgi:hypothetical protein
MVTKTATFQERNNIGESAERRFIGLLMYWGKRVIKTGQENWMPKWVHELLRYIFDDEGIILLRHFPDLATNKALIQIKAAPGESEYDCVTIEEASIKVSMKLFDLGAPVLIVYEYQNGEFYGQWINKLHPVEPHTPREQTKGSHTEYLKLRKLELEPIKEFRSLL